MRRQLVPFVPLGWWMGLRAAWAAVAYACWITPPGRRLLGAMRASLYRNVAFRFILASDLSRSIAIIMPVVFLGCFEFARRSPAGAPRMLLILGTVNLLLPAAHVTYTHIDPINPLPIELIRFLRSP